MGAFNSTVASRLADVDPTARTEILRGRIDSKWIPLSSVGTFDACAAASQKFSTHMFALFPGRLVHDGAFSRGGLDLSPTVQIDRYALFLVCRRMGDMKTRRSALVLRFASADDVQTWHTALLEEVNATRLPTQFFTHEAFAAELIEEIWKAMLAGDRALAALHLSADHNTGIGAIEKRVLMQYMSLVHPRGLLDALDARPYLALLRMVMSSPALRCLFLMFKLSPSVMEDFLGQHSKHTAKPHVDDKVPPSSTAHSVKHRFSLRGHSQVAPCEDVDAKRTNEKERIESLIHWVTEQAAHPEWERIRHFLLQHMQHPAAEDFTREHKLPDDVKWFENCEEHFSRAPMLEWWQLQSIMSAGPYAFFFLAKVHAAESRGRSVLDVLNCLKPKDLVVPFYDTNPSISGATPGNQFVKLAFDVGLSEPAIQGAIIRVFVEKHPNPDKFSRDFCSQALAARQVAAVVQFLQTALISSSGAFNISFLAKVHALPVALFLALTDGQQHQLNNDGIRTVIEFVLRLECSQLPGSPLECRTVKPLSLAIASTGTAHDLLRPKDIQEVLKAARFPHHLKTLCESNMSEATRESSVASAPGSASDTEKPNTARSIYALNHVPSLREGVTNASSSMYRRRAGELMQILYGFVSISLCLPGNTLADWMSNNEEIARAWIINSTLRDGVIVLLCNRYGIRPSLVQKMKSRQLLQNPRQFAVPVIAAMGSYPLSSSDPSSMICGAIIVACASGIDGLKQKIIALDDACMASVDCQAELSRVCTAVITRFGQVSSFAPQLSMFSVEALGICAKFAADALRVVATVSDGRDTLQRLFAHYLAFSEPAAWTELFRSAETVAFFVKYLGREDLNRAYEVFASRNHGNPKLQESLQFIRGQYQTPLLRYADVPETGDKDALGAFITTLEEPLPSEDEKQQVLRKLTTAWMRNRLDYLDIPMAPRNVQVITWFLISKWTEEMLAGNRSRSVESVLAQVGTGEGKSLVIAMTAVYLVLVHHRKVHILENNIGLLARDFGDFETFFDGFGIKASQQDFADTYQVIYCLRRDLEQCYRDGVFQGSMPFDNTVLVVDEVDALIVDDSARMNYVHEDSELSELVPRYFERLQQHGVGAAAPSSWDGFNASVWRQCVDAARSANDMIARNQGYVVGPSGRFELLDENGRMKEHWYTLPLEYIRYTKSGETPHLKTTYFVQSLPHIMRQYSAIIGLSGSLGSPAEAEFLANTYGSWTFKVPPFLETCNPGGKKDPVLLQGGVTMCKGQHNQHDEIIKLAMEMHTKVPVLIIMENPQGAEDMFDALQSKLSARSREAKKPIVQIFIEIRNGKRMPYSTIVQKATEPISVDTTRTVIWPITVTEVFGGRGHDYRISDEDVDEAGGLLVIMGGIPLSEREWVQWKGRTTRNDRRGQYAVVLNASDKFIADKPELVKKHVQRQIAATSSAADADPGGTTPFEDAEATMKRRVYSCNEDLIVDLFKLRDETVKEKLRVESKALVKGMLLNELCDMVFARFKIRDSRWPSCSQHSTLREFLESGDHSVKGIFSVADSMGLNLRYETQYGHLV
jgi:hypothetical protein